MQFSAAHNRPLPYLLLLLVGNPWKLRSWGAPFCTITITISISISITITIDYYCYYYSYYMLFMSLPVPLSLLLSLSLLVFFYSRWSGYLIINQLAHWVVEAALAGYNHYEDLVGISQSTGKRTGIAWWQGCLVSRFTNSFGWFLATNTGWWSPVTFVVHR